MTRPKKQRGIAVIEFAFVLIPLLVVLTGITEFGRAMYYYNTLAKSARDAARLMSTQAPTDPDYATLQQQARCTAIYGNVSCSGSPLLPGLATGMVSFCDPVSCATTHNNISTGPTTGAINLVTVTIGGVNNALAFQSLAPFMPSLFGIAGFNFAPVSVTMRQVS